MTNGADMIEMKLGQGALAGMGDRISANRIPDEAKDLMGLGKHEDVVIHEQFFESMRLFELTDIFGRGN